jgi:hypothetical protein
VTTPSCSASTQPASACTRREWGGDNHTDLFTLATWTLAWASVLSPDDL